MPLRAGEDAHFRAWERLYESGELADMIIYCGMKSWEVHKAVVCSQSTFFLAACRHQFKEAIEGEIDLPDDDDEVIDTMVQFMYTLKYTLPDRSDDKNWNKLLYHSKVYATAEKYGVASLKAAALDAFLHELDGLLNLGHFQEAARHVYLTTPDDDRGLRDLVCEKVYNERMKFEQTRELFESESDILMDCMKLYQDERANKGDINLKNKRHIWDLFD